MELPPSEAALLMQTKPVKFIELAFGDNLWEKQKEIVESIKNNRRTTVRSCHGIGKSFIAARIALWFLYSFTNSKVITTAPTFRQVEDILWREIRNAKGKAQIEFGGKVNQTSIDISEDWFAIGMSTNEPDRFQGFHAVNILLIVDEAAGVSEDVFNASEGIVSSDNAKVLYIGNPTNLFGTFHQSHKLPNWSRIHISAFDTPNFTTFGITLEDIRNDTWEAKINGAPLPRPYLITPEWVRDKFLKWGESSPMWQSRVMGEFPNQGDDTLIPLHYIEQAAMRELPANADDVEVIGADVARFGVDKTVFIYRKGRSALEMKEYSQTDTMDTAQKLHVFAGFHPGSVVRIDEVGVGAGVLDRVKQLEIKRLVEGVNVGLPPSNTEMFVNLRAEMYWSLRERFIFGDICIPNDEELISQLSNLKYEFDNRGRIKIESKEDMKKRGMPSPDKADALCLAFGNVSKQPSILDFMKELSS